MKGSEAARNGNGYVGEGVTVKLAVRTATPVEGKDRSEEKAILGLLKRGNQEGLERIMEKYHDKLYAVAYRICNNHLDAEEVLQDVYMTAMRKIDKFEERSTLSTWIYRITVNAALMKRRSQRHQRSLVSLEAVGSFLMPDESQPSLAGRIRAQDDELMSKELYGRIHDVVDGLPEIYQRVFTLRDIQGYSIKETSRILNTTPAAVKSRLHRGRSLIRKGLRRYTAEN